MLIMLMTVAVCGGAFTYFTMEYLSQITQAKGPPSVETVDRIGLLFLVVTMMAGIPATGMGVYIIYVGCKVRATGRWPPPGLGFRSARPIPSQNNPQVLGILAITLGGLLVACGLSLPLFGWYLVNTLLPNTAGCE